VAGGLPKQRDSVGAWDSRDVASRWRRGAAVRADALGPLTDAMFELAGVTVGSRVLDVGAGTGDQTVLAAHRVGPSGAVLATDVSASMLQVARDAVREAGLGNVQTRTLAAEQMSELEARSFDAAIARFSLQFVGDVGRALAGVRRALKPGGRFAAVVFSAVEKNPFRAAPQAIASRLAGRPFPEPGPGQWALNDPVILREAFQRAGFIAVDVRTVPFVYRFPSLTDALSHSEEQPQFVKLLDALSETARVAARIELESAFQAFGGPDGFEAPSEALIAAGTA
jgi:SAM-dependent methyltransferase